MDRYDAVTRRRDSVRPPCTLAIAFLTLAASGATAQSFDFRLSPDDRVTQRPQGSDVALVQVRNVIRLQQAHDKYGVDGSGCSVAVLDTGINPRHVDFGARIVAQLNYTADNGGRADNATDGNGHGTHVTGIIAANADNVGIAPEAEIIAIKVLSDEGGGTFEGLLGAMRWVLANHAARKICVANLSINDESSEKSIETAAAGELGEIIRKLRDARVAVVVAAGNNYFRFPDAGMSWPAIIPETISVGAVFDADIGAAQYDGGARAERTSADQITPFSQRLPDDAGGRFRTDVFAPGALVTSTGIPNAHGQSDSAGTSQAAPVVAGVVLLAQGYWRSRRNELPSIDMVESWLRNGIEIIDKDLGHDNVRHTNAAFVRVDALMVMEAAERDLAREPT